MSGQPMTQEPSTAPAPAAPNTLRRAARQAARAVALRAVAFVIARPQLDAFLRRQLFRFPGLAGRVRATVARSRRTDWQALPVLATDEAELTDSARQVLCDLRRAIGHTHQH